MISINFRDRRPIYEQVRDSFRQLIITGAMAAGEKIPSVRELSQSLAINPNTIQRAYRELESEGYICTFPGKGSFVCSTDEAIIAGNKELRERFISLSAELLDLGFDAESLISMIKEAEKNDRG